MKTVLMVGNYFQYGQSNPNVWHALAARLRRKGWTVITTSRKRNKLLRLMDMMFTIYRERNNFQVAEVDVFSGPSFIWAEFCVSFLNLLNKKIVLTLHGGNLPALAKKRPDRLQHVLSSAEIVVAPSSYLQEALESLRSDIQMIPNPIDLEVHPYRCRKSAGPNLVWVRAFHEIYNPFLAVKLINHLFKIYPGLHLTMVGPDKGDGSLQRMMKLAERMGVSHKIDIVGGVQKEDVPTYLERSDIFINTTDFDNTPLSVIEAMACGLCVVSTDVGGLPYLLEHEVNALLVPPDDPEAMATAVQRVITEPGLCAKLSLNARKKAEDYDWFMIMPQWENLFTHAIEDTREQV